MVCATPVRTEPDLCRRPFGNARLTSRKGRLGATALQQHRALWQSTLAACMDEVSMVSSDQFLQCDVRMRQAKRQPDFPFGGLAMNVCGDFLQLPPVSRDGSRKSLAVDCNAGDTAVLPKSLDDEEGDGQEPGEEPANAEGPQGLLLWRSFRRVVCLTVNVRAPGVLSRPGGPHG